MEGKHQVHNLVILDESGSMQNIKDLTISGFNELLQNAKNLESKFPDQEHILSFFSFNGEGIKTLHFLDPATSIKELNASNYNPDSMTPLLDAIGFACNKLEQVLKNQVNQSYNVLVTIMTDGLENASKEYSGASIKNLIDRLKNENWTFTYIGTEHDVEKMAKNLSIKNVMRYDKNPQSMKKAFHAESEARMAYSVKISNFRDLNHDDDFYNVKKTD